MKNKNLQKFLYVIIGALVLILGIYFYKEKTIPKLTYVDFINKIENNQVKKVEISNGAKMRVQFKDSSQMYITDNPRNPELKEKLLLHKVDVVEVNSSGHVAMAQSAISMVIIIGVFYVVYKKGSKLNGRAEMGLGAKAVNSEIVENFGFHNIAGNAEAKEQVEDIIDFIKSPEKYVKYGARMPRGMIFYGPPGTGKTLMAKAIAGEANVPFFSVSGSDFVQMYVGVGASRVRELFSAASKHGKAVIFIDEIDAIGKKRNSSGSGSSEEKDQTLNALLTQMSGFHDNQGIVVIAATNRLDILDPALLRPGRFDRHIEIGLPDLNAREKILSLHMKNKPISDLVDIKKIAKQTVYFSGAMLENLLNEAAIFSAKRKGRVIDDSDIDKAFYTVIAGAEKKDRSNIRMIDKEITAYHEAGHALITKLVAPLNTISKVTIIPSTKGAGGFSMNIPPDRMFQTKMEIESQIKISLAGRIAEELIFGEDNITTGASNDIEKATEIIRDYCMRYGMDKEFGMLNMNVLMEKIDASAASQILLEQSSKMIKRLYDQTKDLMIENKYFLTTIANNLLEKETLDEDDINNIMECKKIYTNVKENSIKIDKYNHAVVTI